MTNELAFDNNCKLNNLISASLGFLRVPLAALLFFVFSGAEPALTASGERHVVQQNNTKLHQSPNAASPVVMDLGAGDRLLEYRREGDWIKVAVMGAIGKEGWVSATGLESESPSTGSKTLESSDKSALSNPAPEPALTSYLVKVRAIGTKLGWIAGTALNPEKKNR